MLSPLRFKYSSTLVSFSSFIPFVVTSRRSTRYPSLMATLSTVSTQQDVASNSITHSPLQVVVIAASLGTPASFADHLKTISRSELEFKMLWLSRFATMESSPLALSREFLRTKVLLKVLRLTLCGKDFVLRKLRFLVGSCLREELWLRR
ncbi:hypothetical protein Ddye_013151 [Dipteronia dyeriana]|uniref:Uncharacterized protein n=1 Tax=Dipteronia dyeriana TaxID=168575 RepID=A0AAD9X5M3_9ROSI|nr:hypothetical protein Ddye_013151 [Dipteronia dyeriana]